MTDEIRVGADVGGTFTDVVVLTADDDLVTVKVLDFDIISATSGLHTR